MIEETATESMTEDVLNGCYDETVHFIRALRDNEPPGPSIEEVFPSVELCLRLAKTVEQNAGQVAPVKS